MGRKSTETKLKEQHLAKIAAAEARAEKTRLETAIKSGEYVLRRGCVRGQKRETPACCS
jgi:hypothetical protein